MARTTEYGNWVSKRFIYVPVLVGFAFFSFGFLLPVLLMGYFDAVVSNLVFHEVGDAADRRDVIREALRVLKRGGKFSFQDLFLMKQAYGDTDDLISSVRNWDIKKMEFLRTRDSAFIPQALKLPFMVGAMSIMSGEK